MADAPFFSSQGSKYDDHQILSDRPDVPSSPQSELPSDRTADLSRQKPRKPPTVTPKRFNKFFTPRNSLSTRGGRQSKAGRQLRDITKNGGNRRVSTRQLGQPDLLQSGKDATSERPLKRRKVSVDNTPSSPPQSSPLRQSIPAEPIRVFEDAPTSPAVSDADTLADLLEDSKPFPQPIRRLRKGGATSRLLQRSFGGYDGITRGARGSDHCASWKTETASFVSKPEDTHSFAGTSLPFCTVACNTNSMVASGQEDGSVRLFDSSPTSDFAQKHLAFRPHHNAVMDLAFSSDDYTLATASGDQTSRVIDMHTQKTVCILSGHTQSVKQVQFHPGDDNMLTSSGRDGSVQVWDMRCGPKGSVQSLRTQFARRVDNGGVDPVVRYSKYTMDVGHSHRPARGGANQQPPNTDYSSGLSITAIQHLPGSRSHLLITTSEGNAAIKLWDLRNAGKRGIPTPLSTAPPPPNHSRTRNYGINAVTLSTDGSRLFTLCRDSLVYAYSTSHLALGQASETLSPATARSRTLKSANVGVGPLYAMRNPWIRPGTFYVKASMRPAKDDKSELLALGSSDNCAVVLPTDERHLPRRQPAPQAGDPPLNLDGDAVDLPTYAPSRPHFASPLDVGLQAHDVGTRLTRGHRKEVTDVTWSHGGDLITISDDRTARCWRQDSETARELRSCGEAEGKRWRHGWADVGAEWDEDDG